MVLLALPLCPSLPALDLESAVAMALEGNTDLLEYQLESRSARWALASQLRSFFPELNVAYTSSDSVVTGEADARLRCWSFTMNQLIFSGGRQLAAFRSSKRALQMRDLREADMRLEAAYQVALAFAEVLKNKEILGIRERYGTLLEEQAALGALERDLGLLTSHEFIEIRIRCREYELELRDAREALRESRFSLAVLLSLPSGELPVLEGRLNTEYRAHEGVLSGLQGLSAEAADKHRDRERSVEILQEQAGRRNRDILDLNREESEARLDLRDARLSWLPRIEAEGEYTLSGSVRADEEASFSLGLNLVFDAPLFPASLELQAGKSSPDERNRALSAETDVLQNLETVHEPFSARSRLTLIRLRREELARQISFRVEALADSIILDRERLDIIGEKIRLESEKLKIEETRMKQGELTRLDYVESEIRLADYKTSRIETVTDLYAAEKELERLCGEFPSGGKDGLIFYPEGEE